MDVLDNKCPTCGAKIAFNPFSQMWDCEYCASKFTLEEMKNYQNASSLDNNLEKENKIEEDNNSEILEEANDEKSSADVYCCQNCGAEIMAGDDSMVNFCVYCGSTAILKSKIDEGRLPSLIIPFKTVKEDAIQAFKKLIKGKLLIPHEFKNINNIENIQGVYIPFWSYDLLAEGNVVFDAIDMKKWSDANCSYTETRKYEVEMFGHFEYEKVLARASTRFADDLMGSLEPFKYDELVPYNNTYLTGFLAEKYDIEEGKGFIRASEKTMNTCEAIFKSRIKHQKKIVKNNNMEISKATSHYIMLPVWMVNIKYKDKMYTFAMNGQTGKIVGNIPLGIKEIILWSFGIFIMSFAILFIICWLGYNL